MKRSSGVKKGLRLVATTFFLAAALLSTGCGENALVNPVIDNSQPQDAAYNTGGQISNPGGQISNP